MSPEDHKTRHVQLHVSLDELVADYITHGGGVPSRNSVLDLITWSHEQTLGPDHEDSN